MTNYGDILFDEENRWTDAQDRWEGQNRTGNMADDIHAAHEVMGAPRFELTEHIDRLLGEALTDDENILVRRCFGLGCRRRSVSELAALYHVTERKMEDLLHDALRHLRGHDGAIELWKYLYGG